MKKLQAKSQILKLFPPGTDPVSTHHNHSDDFYLDTLREIQGIIPFRKPKQNLSLSLFLYAGCIHFDRWFVPSPFIVCQHLYKHLDMFLSALIKVEGNGSQNIATFQVHSLKNELYADFDECPLDKVSNAKLDDIENRLNSIRSPLHPVKQKEFIASRNELLKVITALRKRSLLTIFKTRLPYILSRSPLSLSFKWRQILIKMLISPTFKPSGETFVNVIPAVHATGASRWQSGTSDIEIAFSALIDSDAYTESLQIIENHDAPGQGWPKCFTLVFLVVHEVAWRLRLEHGFRQNWIPAPRDIADVESFIKPIEDVKIDFKLKSSPANIMVGFKPSNETVEINFGNLKPLLWSIKCRSLATMYLELGETNEALFWLNVATEALFKERFADIAVQVNRPSLETELNSPRAFWDPAEEIISKQFPEMAGRVQWPETEIHVSIYAKLKYLYKTIGMKTSVKELLKYYHDLSKYRNALFHGILDDRLPIETVKKAIVSFDWIDENMYPMK